VKQDPRLGIDPRTLERAEQDHLEDENGGEVEGSGEEVTGIAEDEQEEEDSDDDFVSGVLPFCGEEVEHIEYGSLSAVAPYVSSPPAALLAAVELAHAAGDDVVAGTPGGEVVVELGCGKGEFIRAMYGRRGQRGRPVQGYLGVDIAEDLIADAQAWVGDCPDLRLVQEASDISAIIADGANDKTPAAFLEADLFEDPWWVANATIVYLHVTPRMLGESRMQSSVLDFLSRSPGHNRLITYFYHFDDASPVAECFVQEHELYSLRLYAMTAT